MNCSQQLASYLVAKVTASGAIRMTALVDTARLDLQHVLIGARYRRLTPSVKAFVSQLTSDPSVTLVIDTKGAVDILIEISTPNLSAFNKRMRAIIGSFTDTVEIVFVVPIIVKREYPRSYLNRAKREVRIIQGDRPPHTLSDLETLVLDRLVADARMPVARIAENTGSSPSRVRTAIRDLERTRVIRGYTVRGDIAELGIESSWLLLAVAGDAMKIESIVTYAEQDRHVVEIIKMLGVFDLALRIEDASGYETLRALRTDFDIKRSMVLHTERVRKDVLMPFRSEMKEK